MSTLAQAQASDLLPTPPTLRGLPLLGHALAFRRDPVELFRRGYAELGPIFTIRLGPKPAAVMLGPEANEFFFSETDRLLSMREVYRFLVPMFGEDFVFVAPEEQYQEQRAILLPAFAARTVDSYVVPMVQETCDWIESLGTEGEFELTESIGTLTMLIATRSFLGDDFRTRAGPEFWAEFRDLAGGIEFLLPSSLPLPRFVKRDRAKRRLQEMIRQIMSERRSSAGPDDMLQTLLDARYSNGEPLSDELLINLILGFMFAGHETTQGHACWALIQLLQHPAYLQTVLQEQANITNEAGDELTAAAIRGMHRLDYAIKETERMLPTVRVLMRYAARSFDLMGYRVPEGWLTVASPDVSHRLPEVFADPDRYDPDRFSPDRAEDKAIPFSLIGFGGGMHRCIGLYFAYTEMKVVLSLLLRRFQLELANPYPQPVRGPGTSRPQAPCIVRYRARGEAA